MNHNRKHPRQATIEKNKEGIKMNKFQVWMYGGQGFDDLLTDEYNTLEEAVDAVRREWPYPQKIVLPNGERYDFTKHGDEWKIPVIYNYMVLKQGDRNPVQKAWLKQFREDPDLKFMMKLLEIKPQSFSEIINTDIEEVDLVNRKIQTLIQLIHMDLIEFVHFYDGSGILDKKWRDV
jgi:hypothetical protein